MLDQRLMSVCLVIMSIVASQQAIPRNSGGQRAIHYLGRTENDLTAQFIDAVIEKLFDRVKCWQRTSDDCKTCLTGVQLFRLLNITSTTLTATDFEQAAKLMLCYARDLESLCDEHDDDDDFRRCDDGLTSGLSDISTPGRLSPERIGSLLSELNDVYEARAEQLAEESEETNQQLSEGTDSIVDENDNDDDTDDGDFDNDSEEDDDVEELTASLFSANCLSTDKLFDDLDDDDDILKVTSIGGLSALILAHLVNGDSIRTSCRTLPTKSSFLDDIYDDMQDKTNMNFEEFKDLLDDLNIGSAQTAARSTRVSQYRVRFPVNRRVARDVASSNWHGKFRNRRSITTVATTAPSNDQLTQSSWDTDRCFSRDELLVMARANKYGGVSRDHFVDICPALIQQQRSSLCDGVIEGKTAQPHRFVYTTIAGLLVCICSLVGAILIPCMGKHIYQTTLVFLLGLAMGTLTGHALMHLIPHAFGLHATVLGRSYRRWVTVQPRWFSLVSFAALYIVYVLECLVEKSRRKSTNDDDNIKSDVEIYRSKPAEFKLSAVSTDLKELTKGVSPTAIVVVVADILFNLACGLSIGAAFNFSNTLGMGTSIFIILEHVAHELGQTAVLLNSGLNMTQTLCLRVCVSLVTMVGAYIGASTGNVDGQRWLSAAVAGMFLYIALSKIVPNVVTAIQQTNFAFKFLVHNIGIFTGVAIIIGLCAIDMSYYP